VISFVRQSLVAQATGWISKKNSNKFFGIKSQARFVRHAAGCLVSVSVSWVAAKQVPEPKGLGNAIIGVHLVVSLLRNGLFWLDGAWAVWTRHDSTGSLSVGGFISDRLFCYELGPLL
jgi:hypothetical protein